MKNYYIAGIVKEDNDQGYSVYFPDVPTVCASGSTLAEAIDHASEGLYLALRGMAEDNQAFPVPSDLETVKAKVKEERLASGFSYPEDTVYQHIVAPALDMMSVRVNITVPKGILEEIDANAKLAGMTRSGFLVAAAQAYAH